MPNKPVTLYLDHSAPPPVVPVSLGDTDWTFQFTVMNNGAVYAPTVNKIIMTGHKPDGNVVAFTGSKSGNVFTVTPASVQLTAVAGIVACELRLIASNGRSVGTGNFLLQVEEGPEGTVTVASSSSLSAYTTILNQLQQIMSQASTIPSDIAGYISDWLEAHITGSQAVAVDDTLTVQGAAADAKETGDRIAAIYTDIGVEESGALRPAGSLDAIINNAGTVQSSNATKAFYVPVEPNTTYKIITDVDAITTTGSAHFYGQFPRIPTVGDTCAQFSYSTATPDRVTEITTGQTTTYLLFGHGYWTTSEHMRIVPGEKSEKTLGERVADLEGKTIETDATLTVEGAAADAKATGDQLKKSVLFSNEDVETSSLRLEKENDKVYAIVAEETTVTPSASGLNDEAISGTGLTYKQLFIDNNLLSDGGGFENGLPSVLVVNAGSPSVTTEEAYTGTHSLKCSGTSSQQYKSTAGTKGTNYVAMMVKVTSYNKGNWGIQMGSTGGYSEDEIEVKVARATNGWERISGVVQLSSSEQGYSFYLGSFSSASGTGYLDNVIITPMPQGVTKAQMDTAYAAYLGIISGDDAEPITVVTSKRYQLSDGNGVSSTATDDECRAAFMRAVNAKAAALGMASSSYVRAGGDTSENQSTVRDMVKMTIEASGYKDIARIWGKDTWAVTTRAGKSIPLTTTVQSASLENYYTLLGGKTGTWVAAPVNAHNLTCVCLVEGELVAGAIGGASSDDGRFVAMKQLMDICKTVLNGGAASGTVTAATYACACVVPPGNVFNYEGFSYEYLYEQAADTVIVPASVTKVISAMTALDYIRDIHASFVFKASDLASGSGAVFTEGDEISIEDALAAMFLPSSNMAAHALARVVGQMVLSYD